MELGRDFVEILVDRFWRPDICRDYSKRRWNRVISVMQQLPTRFPCRFRHVTHLPYPFLLLNVRVISPFFFPFLAGWRKNSSTRRFLEMDGVQVTTTHAGISVSGGRTVSNQTGLPWTLEVLSDWHVVCLVTGDLVSLSEQELVDCDTTNDGCDGGYMDYAFEWVISNGGIDTEADYPYSGVDGTCNTTKEETKVVTIDGYEDVSESDSALLCATVQQPISVGIDGSAIDFQLYTSGIYDGDCSSDPDDIDHAVLIVGYGSEDGEDYWIVKNSWGTDWGIEGYIYIRRDTNLTYGVCAINAMASYPTKESSSTSPPPPPTSVTPPPPPPPVTPPPPPPPPSPSPSECGDSSYCPSDETCCCIYEVYGSCQIYGCCPYENAVCCTGTEYCCPSGYPICDIQEGLCLKNYGDYLGVAARRREMAKHKFPWSKLEQKEKGYQPLKWKRNRLAALHREGANLEVL